jgi:hypothetical protein
MKLLFLMASMVLLMACNSNAQSENEPDLTQTIAAASFQQDFVNFLEEHLTDEDVITVETAPNQAATAKLYKGVAAFWWEGTGNGTTTAKEICKGTSGFAFAKCVKKAIDAGERVTLWKGGDGNYHASI